MTIAWKTDTPATCSLDIRPVGSVEHTLIPGEITSACALTVEGLRPGRQYAYVPLADGDALTAPSVFRTDDRTLPYKFLALGDSGSGKEEQFAVAARMAESPADFILHTGDMIQKGAVAEEWDPKFFVPYQDLLRTCALWPCVGNHDVGIDDGASWRDVFYTPANNPAGSETYYSFHYGNAHFVVLDANDDLSSHSAQHEFLEGELGASTATWKFVVLHETIYSSGFHGSDESIREDILPLIDAYDVDLVFMGHDHDYERTKALRAGEIVAPGEGTVYVTTGGGGATLRSVGTSDFTAHSETTYHFVRVAVDGGALLLDMVRDDGTIGDSMSIVKELPTARDVIPTADTYIEAGEGGTLDHGGADDFKVDAEPWRIAYLKFDLHLVRTGIRSATLTLFPTNSSDNGGTVYSVLESGWVEGEGDGSGTGVGGPGLKWIDVDTNGDGMVDGLDTSPYVPDFSRPVAALGAVHREEPCTVDVTAAFQGRGPGVYTLAIQTEAADGASYAAREDTTLGQEPILHLELSAGFCGNGILEPGEECDDDDCCTACEIVPPGEPCEDDGFFCTGTESCNNIGRCESSGNPCLGGPECADACDEATDTCSDPLGTPCSADGFFCTTDVCDGAGGCAHQAIADCPIVVDPRAQSGQGADHYAVFAGVMPTRKFLLECHDGDPTCDSYEEIDGVCAFELSVCVLQNDTPGATVNAGISVERIVVEPRTIHLSLPPLPASAADCGAANLLRVPLKKMGRKPGKLGLKLVAMSNGKPRMDRDKAVLRCLPGGA